MLAKRCADTAMPRGTTHRVGGPEYLFTGWRTRLTLPSTDSRRSNEGDTLRGLWCGNWFLVPTSVSLWRKGSKEPVRISEVDWRS
jgi:hypothetical protein